MSVFDKFRFLRNYHFKTAGVKRRQNEFTYVGLNVHKIYFRYQ